MQGRSAFGPRRIATTLAVAGAALFLAWSIVRTSAAAALINSNPAAASMINPNDPDVATRLAMVHFSVAGGKVPASAKGAAIAALVRSPMEHEPLILGATDAIAAGDECRGESLLLEARRRSPRSRLANLLLLDRELRAGRIEDATLTMALLTRLVPQAGKALIPELARLAAAEEYQTGVAKVLDADPDMKAAVLDHLAREGAGATLVLKLAGATRPVGAGAEPPRWQSSLVGWMLSNGDARGARELWSRFAGAEVETAGEQVYDHKFQGRPGTAPFNWQLIQGGAGVAEIGGTRSGLHVEYYGRESAGLAEQVLLLPPKRFTIRTRSEGNKTASGGLLQWVLRCRASRRELVKHPAGGKTSTPVHFSVPGNCDSQTLKLEGLPAEFPKSQIVTIEEVSIQEAGR